MKEKAISIFITDGANNGALTAEIINWTRKAIVSPRNLLAYLLRRSESMRTGVFCLVCPDPESPVKDCVYFGVGDSVRSRLALRDREI